MRGPCAIGENAIIKVLESEEEKINGEVFNVGSNDQNFQIYNLAKLIGDSIEKPYEIIWYGESDTRSYQVDFRKIAELLEFKAKYTPKEGAKEVYNALKDGIIEDSTKTYIIKWFKNLTNTDDNP